MVIEMQGVAHFNYAGSNSLKTRTVAKSRVLAALGYKEVQIDLRRRENSETPRDLDKKVIKILAKAIQ